MFAGNKKLKVCLAKFSNTVVQPRTVQRSTHLNFPIIVLGRRFRDVSGNFLRSFLVPGSFQDLCRFGTGWATGFRGVSEYLPACEYSREVSEILPRSFWNASAKFSGSNGPGYVSGRICLNPYIKPKPNVIFWSLFRYLMMQFQTVIFELEFSIWFTLNVSNCS